MPTKKAIKVFVQYIQRNDTEAALSALADDPSLALARCSSPPKKYDGQSLLHIAMRNGNSRIAIALIDAGSDVNLIEESSVNEWNSPPLHDGIEVAVWATLEQDDEFIESHLKAIEHLLKAGADPNLRDSRGATAHCRFIVNASKRVEDLYFDCNWGDANYKFKYLKQLHELLLEHGAEPWLIDDDGNPTLTASEKKRIGIS